MGSPRVRVNGLSVTFAEQWVIESNELNARAGPQHIDLDAALQYGLHRAEGGVPVARNGVAYMRHVWHARRFRCTRATLVAHAPHTRCIWHRRA
eukprot:1146960-Prymnesium_polylepis.2